MSETARAALAALPPERLALRLKDEPLQIATLVLSVLPPERAAVILDALPSNVAGLLLRRLGDLCPVRPEIETAVLEAFVATASAFDPSRPLATSATRATMLAAALSPATRAAVTAHAGRSAILAQAFVEPGPETGHVRVLNEAEIEELLGLHTAASDAPPVFPAAAPPKGLDAGLRRMVVAMTHPFLALTAGEVEITVDMVSSVRWQDHLHATRLPAGFLELDMGDCGTGLLVVDEAFAVSLADILCGGRRSLSAMHIGSSRISAATTALLTRAVETAVAPGLAGLGVETVRPVRWVANPRHLVAMDPVMPCLRIALRADFEDKGGRFDILLPWPAVEVLGPRLEARGHWADPSGLWARRMGAHAEEFAGAEAVELRVVMGTLDGSGDGARLSTAYGDRCLVMAGDRPVARGEILPDWNGGYAVRLLEVL